MASKSVALITMSLRPARVGVNVAAFVKPILEKALASSDIKVAPVDVRDFKLPIFDENVAPASKCPLPSSAPSPAPSSLVYILLFYVNKNPQWCPTAPSSLTSTPRPGAPRSRSTTAT